MKAYVSEIGDSIVIKLWIDSLTCIKTVLYSHLDPKTNTQKHHIISEKYTGVSDDEGTEMGILELVNYTKPLKNVSPAYNTYLIFIQFLAKIKFDSMPKYGEKGLMKNENVKLSERVAEGRTTAPPLSLPSTEKKEYISHLLKFKERCLNIFSSIKAFV